MKADRDEKTSRRIEVEGRNLSVLRNCQSFTVQAGKCADDAEPGFSQELQ